MSRRGVSGLLFAFLLVSLSPVGAESGEERQRLIIRYAKPYDRIVAAIQGMGGVVTQRYENVDGVAATIPKEKLTDVLALAGLDTVYKDVMVEPPRPAADAKDKAAGDVSLEAEGVRTLDPMGVAEVAKAQPADYLLTNAMTGAGSLHALGILGGDVIVGVIDTGTANNASTVPALAGTVIGGESFVVGDPVSATSTHNGNHGTQVGTVIAGHALFFFDSASTLVGSVAAHAPDSVLPCATFGCDPTQSVIPMIGTAPSASIYALKVFASTGEGAPESVVIAAMDRALTLRRNYDQGVPSVPTAGSGTENDPFRYESLKIDVVNMSLGGPTLFAGRDLEDELTRKMLRAGITVVTSAGNDGFAALTGGSPGTGFGALTVGAASTPAHERILRDLQLGPGMGDLYRPFDKIQTAEFSSRGPTADGRFDPDVTANGFATFVQGAGGGLALANGTSFSSPTVAGLAALLRDAVPWASAVGIRNALVHGANPHLLGDGSARIDQGRGFVDVVAARRLLHKGHEGRRLPAGFGTPSLERNIRALGFRPICFRHDRFTAHVSKLRPGQVAQFFVPSEYRTDKFVVRVKNVTPALPPDQQNALFGDDIFVKIADAPTSFWSSPCALPPPGGQCEAFVRSDATIEVSNPQTGLVRVALQGDWTNAGKVSADLVIERVRTAQGPPTDVRRILQGQLIPVPVDIPPGTSQAVFELSWKKDWGHYPTNDLDLILLGPALTPNHDGATLASPERVAIDSPAPGRWYALVQGATVFGRDDDGDSDDEETFTLRVTADGVRLDRAH